MKSLLNLQSVIFISLIIFVSISCHNKDKVEVFEPAEADSTIASLNEKFLEDSLGSYIKTAGVPSLWQSFETFFKNCVKTSGIPSNSLFSKYRLLYLGPSNPRYLGTVYSSNGVETKTELTKWIPKETLNTFISKGINVPSCDITSIKDQFISISLGKLPFTTSDTTLKFILKNQDTVVNSVGMWAIDEINTADFLKYLNDNLSSNDNIKFYKDVMTSENNVVAFKVVKVTGFAADIKTSSDIKVGVNLNVPIVSVKATSGKDSVVCSFGFSKTNNRTVHVQSDGEFYAFALVMKGRKI